MSTFGFSPRCFSARPALVRCLVIAAITASAGACATGPSAATQLDADLERMMRWFPGVYDNHIQVYTQAKDEVAQADRHRHTNHTFQPLAIEGIPGPTLYAQQYQHYDPTDLYRQRIYAFDIDAAEGAIRLTIYTPKDPSRLTDAHLDPTRVADLTADDFILKPGCEVYWTFDGDQYNGYLKPNACSYYSTRFETQVYLNETLTLRRDALLLDDSAVDGAGNPVFGVGAKGPTVNLKQAACTASDSDGA